MTETEVEFERGRKAGLQQAIDYHDRAESEAYRDLSDAERRFDAEDGKLANRAIKLHSTAIEHLRGAIENDEYFGKAPR